MVHVKFDSVGIAYNSYQILEQFDLNISKGEVVTLFGPSGCGKTSLMKATLGILKVNQGVITISSTEAELYQRVIAYVPQDNQLLPWLTIEENVDLWRVESGNNEKSHTADVIKLVGLEEHSNKLVKELSGGMTRRAALARGLVAKSNLLCLDEVLVSIERGMRRELMTAIRKYVKDNQITTLLISHDYEEAVYMSDRIILLSPSPTEILKEVSLETQDRDLSFFDSNEFLQKSGELIH